MVPYESVLTPFLSRPAAEVSVEAVNFSRLHVVRRLNRVIFGEDRIINRFDRTDLVILLAYVGREPVGFKVGYGESEEVFYSAKGGVLETYRRRGIALRLLDEMERIARDRGYRRFAYDTFPNRHPGMLVLGLKHGYRLVGADYNEVYKDYRLRLERGV